MNTIHPLIIERFETMQGFKAWFVMFIIDWPNVDLREGRVLQSRPQRPSCRSYATGSSLLSAQSVTPTSRFYFDGEDATAYHRTTWTYNYEQ